MALQVEGLAVGRLTLGTELCVIDGCDVGIGLDAYLGGTGPGIAVNLALGNKLQVAAYGGGLQFGHL